MKRDHGAELRRLNDAPVLSERIIQDYRRAGLDEKTRTMLDYAIKSTRTPVNSDEAGIEKPQNLGFSFDDDYIIIECMTSIGPPLPRYGGWEHKNRGEDRRYPDLRRCALQALALRSVGRFG